MKAQQLTEAAKLLGVEITIRETQGRWYGNLPQPPYPPDYPDAFGNSEEECVEMLRSSLASLIHDAFKSYEYVHHRAILKNHGYLAQRMENWVKSGFAVDNLGIGPSARDLYGEEK